MTITQNKLPVVASIVLYKHKREQIQPTLNSLLQESLVKTIVLVDNSDCQWAGELNDPRIDYIKSEKNKGYGDGHNQAMEKYLSQCEYFIICNPDIEFEQGTVEQLYRFAKENNRGLIAPKIVYPNGEVQYVCRLLPTPFNLILRRFIPCLSRYFDNKYELRQMNYNQNFFTPIISGCFMFVKSILLKEVNGFDTRYFMYLEDIDLCRKIQDLQYDEPIFYHEATVTHAFQKGSYRSLKLLSYHINSAIAYFNKWGWFYDPKRRKLNKKCLEQIQSSIKNKEA